MPKFKNSNQLFFSAVAASAMLAAPAALAQSSPSAAETATANTAASAPAKPMVFAPGAAIPRPADWIAHTTHLRDSRPLGETLASEPCDLEIIEIKYASTLPKAGAVLLIPGLFNNSFFFDVLPEENISYARWLMREKGLQVYLLNARGEGDSCYPANSELDDIAIDDIPTAIRYVSEELERGKIFVMGHSQGAITLQASLAGLSRCENGVNCFKADKGLERQAHVKAGVLLAGNVAMTSSQKTNPLISMAVIDDLFGIPLTAVVDRIPASLLTQDLSPSDKADSIAYANIWNGVYHMANVTHDAQKAVYDKALDASTFMILDQYARGIQFGGIASSSGQKYADHLVNIVIPTATGTFGYDTLSDPQKTITDDYDRLGSRQKASFFYPNEGHEDFALNASFHAHQSALWDWTLANGQ